MADQISAYVIYEWPFSCHEVKNSGYAIPNGVVVQPENFYAATDIVLKVRIGPAAVFFFFLLCTMPNLVVEIRLKYQIWNSFFDFKFSGIFFGISKEAIRAPFLDFDLGTHSKVQILTNALIKNGPELFSYLLIHSILNI